MKLSFDPQDEDGAPRQCVGMHRRPWEKYANLGGYVVCTCGAILQTTVAVRDHWQMGHYDQPLYDAS